MSILIRNGIIVGSGQTRTADVLVSDGRIVSIGPDISAPSGVRVFDAEGCIVCPALADVHVHFREPGFSEKETIRTGSLAAAHGGYTLVCTMPNLSPAPDSPESIAVEREIIERDAVIDVRPYATVTKGRSGGEVVDVKSLMPLCVGFSDDGSGVQDSAVMESAMKEIASEGGILAAHCEDNSLLRGGYIHDGEYAARHGHKGICSESEWGQIVRDIELARRTGCHYHVCHISTKESVDAIRRAKAEGVNVTCETAPHYLALCEDDLREDGRFKMNPPLRSAADRHELIEGLKDGTIDVIATDHAPHTAEQKSRGLQGSAMGIVGLETAFPVVYTSLVKSGVISVERLVEAMGISPRRVFNLGGGRLEPGAAADIAVFNVRDEYVIDPGTFLSKGRSTPFEGMRVYGKCMLTLYGGAAVWDSENI